MEENKKVFKTKQEIMKFFNTTKLVEHENIIQVFDFYMKEYHYLVENCYGWTESGMTSYEPKFFTQISTGE